MTTQKTQILLNSITCLVLVATLTSCGNSKSSGVNQNNLSSAANLSGKPLASCNKSISTDISMTINATTDANGQIDPNWTKVKFNFLSAKATASGNTVRFFKWKVSGNQSTLDQNPLSTMFFNLESGQPTTNSTTTIPVAEIATTRGIYVELNDPQASYQVIKAVVYDSNGQIVAQLNSLIPQFNSIPNDYKLNYDGSARAQVLVDLHPLISTNTSAWSQTDYANYYQNFCF